MADSVRDVLLEPVRDVLLGYSMLGPYGTYDHALYAVRSGAYFSRTIVK